MSPLYISLAYASCLKRVRAEILYSKLHNCGPDWFSIGLARGRAIELGVNADPVLAQAFENEYQFLMGWSR